MKYRFIVHENEDGIDYISTIILDDASITHYPSDVKGVYVTDIESAKILFQTLGIDIQPILTFEETL